MATIFHLSPLASSVVSRIDGAGAAISEAARTPGLTALMKVVTEAFDPVIVLAAACCIAAFFFFKKDRFSAIRFAASVAAISAMVWLAKHLVVRTRPAGGLIQESGFSFPSGHAAVSAVFFYVLYMSVSARIASVPLRRACLALAIAMPLLIGFSRVYLGVHYLSDVLGGFLFGAMVASAAVLMSERKAAK